MRHRPEVIVDQDMIIERDIHDEFALRWKLKWQRNFDQFRGEVCKVMQQTSIGRSKKFNDIFSHYRREYINDSEAIYEEFYAQRPALGSATRVTSGGQARDRPGHLNDAPVVTPLRALTKFEAQHKNMCRQYLASLVYDVVYIHNNWCRSGRRLEADSAPSVIFCWEVCSSELHSIKLERYRQQNGRDPLEDILLN